MLLSIAAIVVGLALLVWSADRFVLGASATASDLGVSPMIIGLLIVGFATSAPEMLVAGFAAWQGNPALGIGNAVGSNIANIALILGGAALLRPLATVSNILTRELPLLIVLTALAVLLALDGDLRRLDGAILVLALFGAMAVLLRQALAQREEADPLAAELAEQVPTSLPLRWALLWLAVGLILLLVSSRMLVWGGVNIAETLGVSDLVIGLTIVAVGTSLPELGPIPPEVLTRDLPVMCALTLLLIPALAHRRGRSGRIGRVEGLLLVSCFIAYEGWLFATL